MVQTEDITNQPSQTANTGNDRYYTKLARTGAESLKLVMTGLGLITVGGMLLILRRRRRLQV